MGWSLCNSSWRVILSCLTKTVRGTRVVPQSQRSHPTVDSLVLLLDYLSSTRKVHINQNTRSDARSAPFQGLVCDRGVCLSAAGPAGSECLRLCSSLRSGGAQRSADSTSRSDTSIISRTERVQTRLITLCCQEQDLITKLIPKKKDTFSFTDIESYTYVRGASYEFSRF